jgi:putative transposase
MAQTNVIQLGRPAFDDSLTDVIRHGARELLKKAVEEEVQEWLESHRELRTAEGKQAIVRERLPARARNTDGYWLCVSEDT